jgi:hypothetical protein
VSTPFDAVKLRPNQVFAEGKTVKLPDFTILGQIIRLAAMAYFSIYL